VGDRGAIERDRPALLAALGQCPHFEGAPPAVLAALLQGARTLSWRVGLASPTLLGRDGGFGLVRSGQLVRVHARDAAGSRHRHPAQDLLEVADPDDCAFFAESTSLADEGAWRARLPARVVYIARGRAQRVLGAHLDLAAQLQVTRRHRRALAAPTSNPADVVLFEALAPVPEVALQRLAEAVAHRVAADFGESVAVLNLVSGAARGKARWAALTAAEASDAHAAAVCGCTVKVGADAVAALRKALAELDAQWPAGLRPPSRVWVLAAPDLPTAALRPWCDRTVLIDPDGRAAMPATPPGLPMIFARARAEGGPLPRPDRPNTVRLPFALGALDPAQHAAPLAALGRALTGRRVGVALGGGGAWGYVHLAMLTHLSRRSVPVDSLSGASFGAVVGASFAAGGLAGLDRLLAHQRPLSLAVAAGVFSGGALERFFDGLFTGPDGRALDLRETPVAFLPACTDLVTASQTPLLEGTLGYGVRASGSMPPVFASTPRGGSVLLDGAFSANVPAVICANEGMDLVLASEVIPAFKAPPGHDPGGLREVLMGLNPLRRLRDLVLGVSTLVETSSETSAMVARVVFAELARPQVLPLALSDAEGVIEAAVSDPAFWNTLRRVEDLWARLAEPRRTH
jgi:NTE family protein